jgi:glucuronosyltransferase
LESKGLKTLESYPDNFKFDVVINDFTGSPCLLGFLDKFKYPPLIGVSAFNNPPFAPDLVGGQRHFYTPYYIFEYGTDMTYWQRLHNTFFHIFDF